MLRHTAGGLLNSFSVSTKVGFFPACDGGRPTHDLNPDRLRSALEQSAEELGQRPSVVLLHNPEESLRGLSAASGADTLIPACGALKHAVSAGLADSWGISTWQPRSIADALTSVPVDDRPRPAVVMVRSGLLVSAPGLEAGEHLAALLNPVQIWGMSPFGGDTSDPVWKSIDSRLFLAADQPCSRWQAAFRVAAELPNVDQLVVGTDSVEHVRELVEAAELRPNREAVTTYRRLLQVRAAQVRTSTH
jgi:pyridoxine 4-dehydrogenase